eukprot:gene7727-8566_t
MALAKQPKKGEATTSSLFQDEETEVDTGQITTQPSSKKRKKRKRNEVDDQINEQDKKVRDTIALAKSRIVSLAESKCYFSVTKKLQVEAGQTYNKQDMVCFANMAKLMKSFGSTQQDSGIENIVIDNASDSVPDVIGKCIHCQSASPLVISAFETRFILPSFSTFFISDVEEVHCLLDLGVNYDVIVMDPPWENKSVKRSKRYDYLPLKEIESLPIEDLASEGGLVVVWVTNKRKIIDFVKEKLFPSWKIELIGEWYWLKVTRHGEFVFDLDSVHKKPYEQLIIGRKPNTNETKAYTNTEDVFPFTKFIVSVPSVLHSRKPPLQEVLEQYLPVNPKCLELFARCLLPGWTSWGNEVQIFFKEYVEKLKLKIAALSFLTAHCVYVVYVEIDFVAAVVELEKPVSFVAEHNERNKHATQAGVTKIEKK